MPHAQLLPAFVCKLEVSVCNDQRDLSLSEASVRLLVQAFLNKEGQHTDEVSIYFVSKDAIVSLHEEFFQDPTPTDCISFPMDQGADEDYHILGEIFICPCVAIEYAASIESDPYEETSLYLVHGLLHLLGYDDQEEPEQTLMRAKEREHMNFLIENKLLLKKDYSNR